MQSRALNSYQHVCAVLRHARLHQWMRAVSRLRDHADVQQDDQYPL